jgi:hypothetical protein
MFLPEPHVACVSGIEGSYDQYQEKPSWPIAKLVALTLNAVAPFQREKSTVAKPAQMPPKEDAPTNAVPALTRNVLARWPPECRVELISCLQPPSAGEDVLNLSLSK